ncbi:hypothetical protein BIW11_13521, partial [Tropilaelaps mercedesae]
EGTFVDLESTAWHKQTRKNKLRSHGLGKHQACMVGNETSRLKTFVFIAVSLTLFYGYTIDTCMLTGFKLPAHETILFALHVHSSVRHGTESVCYLRRT